MAKRLSSERGQREAKRVFSACIAMAFEISRRCLKASNRNTVDIQEVVRSPDYFTSPFESRCNHTREK
jgi:hypothetical protein